MEMILEGSNSAEASPPSGGGTGSHLLPIRDGGGGLVVDFLVLFSIPLHFVRICFLTMFIWSIELTARIPLLESKAYSVGAMTVSF